MPQTKRLLSKQNIIIQLIDAVFRSCGQVIFMNNSISGLFVVIAIFN